MGIVQRQVRNAEASGVQHIQYRILVLQNGIVRKRVNQGFLFHVRGEGGLGPGKSLIQYASSVKNLSAVFNNRKPGIRIPPRCRVPGRRPASRTGRRIPRPGFPRYRPPAPSGGWKPGARASAPPAGRAHSSSPALKISSAPGSSHRRSSAISRHTTPTPNSAGQSAQGGAFGIIRKFPHDDQFPALRPAGRGQGPEKLPPAVFSSGHAGHADAADAHHGRSDHAAALERALVEDQRVPLPFPIRPFHDGQVRLHP